MENGIKEPNDWGKITWKQWTEANGRPLLNHYHNSIFLMLKTNFPGMYALLSTILLCSSSYYLFFLLEITWKEEWFQVNKLPTGYWDNKENQRKFLENFQIANNIRTPS